MMFAPAGTPLTASAEWEPLPIVEGGFEVAAEPWHSDASVQPLIDAERRELDELRRIKALPGPNRATRRKQEREARRARRGQV